MAVKDFEWVAVEWIVAGWIVVEWVVVCYVLEGLIVGVELFGNLGVEVVVLALRVVVESLEVVHTFVVRMLVVVFVEVVGGFVELIVERLVRGKKRLVVREN